MKTTPVTDDADALASASDVLSFARERRVAADRAEAELLLAACAWADLHPAESVDGASTYWADGFGDTGIPVAGAGAPLVAEFAVAELAAVLGLTTEAGRRLVGHALELRHRLPRLWARVQAVELPAWRARRVAEATLALSVEAAAFVDAQVAAVAHKTGPAQVDRLVAEAIARFMPETADAARAAAADRRHFTVEHGRVSFEGTSLVHGELDLADALDLEAAIAHGAAVLAALGSTDTLDVRRAAAAGDLARRQLALDLTDVGADGSPAATRAEPSHTEPTHTEPTSEANSPTGPTGRAVPRARQVVLFVHLSEAAVFDDGVEAEIARVENTGAVITADTIRDWCGRPGTQVVVKPVIDLNDRVDTRAYEVPDRIAERVALRDLTCSFPFCQRPARRCDVDHVVPHPRGPTATDNLAALCRRHHRLKTLGGWTYTMLAPGEYLWRSPHGFQFLRDHTGTLDVSRDVTRDRRSGRDGEPAPDE